MARKIYASRSLSNFPLDESVREHGGFYVASVPGELAGTFEIIAIVDESEIFIECNSTNLDYTDMTDLLEWAYHSCGGIQ